MASSSKESAAKADLLGKRNPEDNLETKPFLKKHKETSDDKETTEGPADDSLQHKSDQANLSSVKETETVEGLDLLISEETPIFAEEAPVIKNTLFVSGLSRLSKIRDIINFFKDVGKVVHVRLVINQDRRHVGYGYVEFASSNETKMALEKKNFQKNGGALHDHKIHLRVAKIASQPPKFCIDHKVCYQHSLRQPSLPIQEVETPRDFVEQVILVANLSPRTKLSHLSFFYDVGRVVSVRLIVNHERKHVGYGFVEFASAYEANEALEEKNGEYLHDRKVSLMKGHDATLDFVEEDVRRRKTLFICNLARQSEISDIIDFFKDAGEVCHVRLLVTQQGKQKGWGFVEFASANDAEKALEKKNGEYLHDYKITLGAAMTVPNHPPKSCMDYMAWCEDYLPQESLVLEEDEAVEGLDKTPDFLEAVAARKEKTLFVSNLPFNCDIIPMIINFFKDVGQVVCVRLNVDDMGNHVGCGFVEFNSVNEAEEALEKKNGNYLRWKQIFLDVAEIAPYPLLRPTYEIAEKLWYEDNLRRESLNLEARLQRKKQKEMPRRFCGEKIIFSCDD